MAKFVVKKLVANLLKQSDFWAKVKWTKIHKTFHPMDFSPVNLNSTFWLFQTVCNAFFHNNYVAPASFAWKQELLEFFQWRLLLRIKTHILISISKKFNIFQVILIQVMALPVCCRQQNFNYINKRRIKLSTSTV